MSDLYLVLRRRLDAVADWVELGVEAMSSAQKALGLSDERAARLVPVSGRTWTRWRAQGRVPAHSVDKVAAILGLEIERPTSIRIVLPEDESADLAAVMVSIKELGERLDSDLSDLGRKLDALDRKIDLVDPSNRLTSIESELRRVATSVGL